MYKTLGWKYTSSQISLNSKPILSSSLANSLKKHSTAFGHFSWYWKRPSYVIIWQHEKQSVWCVFYTQPSLDRRRKNSQQRLGSCWSLSTLAVSLSVIIFHACHFDQIYTACVLFIRPSIWGQDVDAHSNIQLHTYFHVSTVTWFLWVVMGRYVKKILPCWDINLRSDLSLNEAGIDWLEFPTQWIALIIYISSWFAVCQVDLLHLHSPSLLAGCLATLLVCAFFLSVCIRVSERQMSIVFMPALWYSVVSYQIALNASRRERSYIKNNAIKMERSGSCWVRPSDKKGLRASKAVFTPLPLCTFSLSLLPPVTLNRGLTFSRGHPWLAVKRRGINVREWREWSVGHRVGGVGLVGVSEWLSEFLMECRHGWLTLCLSSTSSLILVFFVCLSISIFCPFAGVIPLASYPPPTFLSSHPLKPYCFTCLHSGFYGCFVLVQTHLTAGWWVPPPVIAAIYYQRRSTSHFSDFGKMVFTLDHFTDLPYNKSTRGSSHKHMHTDTHSVTQPERRPHHHHITLQIYKELKCYVAF